MAVMPLDSAEVTMYIRRHTLSARGRMAKPAGAGMVRYSTFLRRDQLARLRAIQVETGVPVAEQIRRAIDARISSEGKRGRR
jgi:hypothetical protein